MFDRPYGGRLVITAALLIRMSIPPTPRLPQRPSVRPNRPSDVEMHRDGLESLAVQRVSGVLCRIGVDVGDDDRSADATQRLGIDLADAAGSACDHCDLASEIEKLLHVHPSIRHTLDL